MNHSNKIAFYTLCITLVFLFSLPPCFATDTEDSKQVVFVRYNLKDKTSPPSAALDSFKKKMKERGYEEGKNINYIDFVTNYPERKSASEILAVVDKYISTADMFITTSWTSLYVRSKLAKNKVPQLFVPALKSTALNMLSSVETVPNTNLSGIYLMYPPEKILRLTRNILPNATKYAFVYDSRMPADIIFKSAYGQLNVHERHGLTIYFLDLANGTDTVIQKMSKMGIEVFGGTVGLLKNLKALAESQLPIVTGILFDRDNESFIKSIKDTHIIAGLYNPFDYCGEQAAEMTADIFEGKASIEKMTPRPARQIAFVNLVAAKKVNKTLPFSVLEAADIVIK